MAMLAFFVKGSHDGPLDRCEGAELEWTRRRRQRRPDPAGEPSLRRLMARTATGGRVAVCCGQSGEGRGAMLRRQLTRTDKLSAKGSAKSHQKYPDSERN